MPGLGEEHWQEHDAGASRRAGSLSALLAAAACALEAEQDRWFLWLPVLFAGGIVAYFALLDEPGARTPTALLLGAAGLCLFARHKPLGLCIGGAALAFATGFACAKLRTETVRAPVLATELRYVNVTGWVEAHTLRDKGRARLTLRVLSLGDLAAEERPYRVRMSVPAGERNQLLTGEAISLHATLRPPPEPIAPGGFDFARQAWFDRLGATGYATSKIIPLGHKVAQPWDLAVWAKIDAVRDTVNGRIKAALPGESGAVAIALITGERGGVSREVTEAMRDSGLAHVLAISGLHMAIMAGTVFWLARALLALIPGLALRYPIKKWAAGIAIGAASFYLALSGASVPTVRSWIMMSIVL
ncbi:MAG: ComEC/Rec2 family competence protein, partial [Methyloceanibacter sp.]